MDSSNEFAGRMLRGLRSRFERRVRRWWTRIFTSTAVRALRRWIRRGSLHAPSFSELPVGQRGEALAAEFLADLGYTIVARGERARWSEIDLVAVDGQVVVFVEVKSRVGKSADPFAAVDRDKQVRLTRAALVYMKRHQLLQESARFDVVGVTWRRSDEEPTIQHLKNAFQAQGKWQLYR